MSHHSIVCRLDAADTAPVTSSRPGSQVTEISFVDGYRRLSFGLGHALDQLSHLGLRPSERAVDLALLAASVTAADTRISRDSAEDAWTREIDVHVPVAEPAIWAAAKPLIDRTLHFLTGDRWATHFRPRIDTIPFLALASEELRTATITSVCLFSGGLDSFIGAIDLLAAGETPLLVSHYWDGITSKHQTDCFDALKTRFPRIEGHHVRARVGFPKGTVEGSLVEDTLRGRSFMFFALAALAADAIGGALVVHVPENAFISLNVPLDPLRLGALSTRTTHPFYMARFNELLQALGLTVRLDNAYRHKTKGEMAKECRDVAFLKMQARHTMSCSSPAKNRFASDASKRHPMNCGSCVPCLIRRAAILEAWGSDDTPYYLSDLDAQPLDTNRTEGAHVRSFQLALSRNVAHPGRARFDIHRPGPLIDHPNDLAAYEAVYVRGLHEVGRLLANVTAKPL